MAEINIQTKIETAEAAKGLKDLRTSLRDLVSAQSQVGAGTAEFTKLQNAINKTENKLSDLTDAFGTLKGSGVDRLNSSFSLLREGFASADPGKVTIGMQGLGAAMKAIPIFLIIEGIKFLVESFDKLKGSGGLVGEAIGWISTKIGEAIEKLKEFSDWIGLTSFAAKDAAREQLDAAKKSTDAITTKADLEIRLAKASGKEISEIEKQKIKDVQESLQKQLDALNALAIAKGGYGEDEKKQLKEIRDAYHKLGEDKQVIEAEQNKKHSDLAKQRAADDLKIQLDAQARDAAFQNYYIDKAEKDAKDLQAAKVKQANEAAVENAAIDAKEKADKEAVEVDAYNKRVARNGQEFEDNKRRGEEELALKKRNEQMAFDTAAKGVQAIGLLTDVYFNIKNKKAKGNAAEELKLAKKQFNINKGLQIAQATIQGIQAVMAAYSSGVATPLVGPAVGAAYTAATAILAAANIAKIASVQFEGGGSGGASAPSADIGSISTPSAGSGGDIGSTPTPVTSFNPNAIPTGAKDSRVWVLESDITKTQNKVSVIEHRATFP